MNVGDTLTTRAQIADLPVGAVIAYTGGGNDWRYTKEGPNRWVDHAHNDSIVPDSSFSLGMNQIRSLPGAEAEPVNLEAVPVGATVSVNDSHTSVAWTRTTDGLQHPVSQVILPTSFFAGAAAAGLVTAPSQQAVEQSPTPPVAEQPAAPAVAVDHAAQLRDEYQRGLAAGQVGRLTTDAVTDAFTEAWDGVSFTLSEINDVLEGLGCDRIRRQEDVAVTVSVDGHYELETDEAERLINDSRVADVEDSITIPFTYSTTVEREEEEGMCACNQIERETVEALLEANDIRWSDFTFEVECANC
jgi:hypothetical protein